MRDMFDQMTDKQRAAWPEAIEKASAIASETLSDRPEDWYVKWGVEVRPGRGRSMNAVYWSGETVVQVLMDVYGYPDVTVGMVTVLHCDGDDDECDCSYCLTNGGGE